MSLASNLTRHGTSLHGLWNSIGYDTAMMRLACADYRQIASEFAALEKQYIELRNELFGQ